MYWLHIVEQLKDSSTVINPLTSAERRIISNDEMCTRTNKPKKDYRHVSPLATCDCKQDQVWNYCEHSKERMKKITKCTHTTKISYNIKCFF